MLTLAEAGSDITAPEAAIFIAFFALIGWSIWVLFRHF